MNELIMVIMRGPLSCCTIVERRYWHSYGLEMLWFIIMKQGHVHFWTVNILRRYKW